MRNDESGNTPLRAITILAATALALAALAGNLASQGEDPAVSASVSAPATYQDPSIAGLSVSPDAEPGEEQEAVLATVRIRRSGRLAVLRAVSRRHDGEDTCGR